MTKQELIRSFVNAPSKCKQQCMYQKQCHMGDFCVLKEAALIMSSDAVRIAELDDKLTRQKEVEKSDKARIAFLEERCTDYYDSIHDYNGGVVKKLYISPKRKMAAERRRRTVAARAKDKTQFDGDPRYAQNSSDPASKEAAPEVVV